MQGQEVEDGEGDTEYVGFFKCRLHVLLDSEGDRHRSRCSCSGTTACILTTACLFPTPPPGPALPSQGAAGAGLFGSLDHAGVELGVAAGVLGQVVAPHEPLLAEGAPELLLASVGSVVPRQLVRAGELFKAVGPRAGEWSLTCVEERMTDLGGQGKCRLAHASFAEEPENMLLRGKSCFCFLPWCQRLWSC